MASTYYTVNEEGKKIFFKCVTCRQDKKPNRGNRCDACRYAKKKANAREAMEMLGGYCRRCYITAPLVWDHINDDGHLERRRDDGTRTARSVWQINTAEIMRIRETGQSDKLQLLCPNCNHLKAVDPEEYKKPPTYGPLA